MSLWSKRWITTMDAEVTLILSTVPHLKPSKKLRHLLKNVMTLGG